MDWKVFWKHFHQAWGHCHESPEYNKQIWNEMQMMLQQYEKRIIDLDDFVRKEG